MTGQVVGSMGVGNTIFVKFLLFRRFWRQVVRILDFCKENCKETDPPAKWIFGGQEVPSRFVRPHWPELDWREWTRSRTSKRVAKGSPGSLGSLMDKNSFYIISAFFSILVPSEPKPAFFKRKSVRK